MRIAVIRSRAESRDRCSMPSTRPRAVVCWRWPRSTMVAAGVADRQSVCRSFAGCVSEGGRRTHPRSSTADQTAVPAWRRKDARWLFRHWTRCHARMAFKLPHGEARIGQKNKLDGPDVARARAPRDQRTEWAYIFGAMSREGERRRAGLLVRHRRHPRCRSIHAVLIVGWRSPTTSSGRSRLDSCANWLEPDLQILRRHRRAVLPSLEQPHRPSMEDHVPRHAQMGPDQ